MKHFVALSDIPEGCILKNINVMGETIDSKPVKDSTIVLKAADGINIISLIDASGVIDTKRSLIK